MIKIEVKCFNDVVEQLCNVRKCFLEKHTGNVYTIHSSSLTLTSDVMYFDAASDCYTATVEGINVCILDVDFTTCTIRIVAEEVK